MTIAPARAEGGHPLPPASRFERKRQHILDVATTLMNQRGVKGMTLQDIAQAVQLNISSVTHYFRLKDHLAAAVFELTLDRLEAMVAEAGASDRPRERVRRYLALHFDYHAKALKGEERGLAILSDIRALDDRARLPLEAHYRALFRRIRDFFGPPADEQHKALLTARTQMLTEVTFWLPVWINHYSISDFARVQERLFAILADGIAPDGADWTPVVLSGLDDRPANMPETGRSIYLKAATRLVNDLGYRGASVDRIVAELNVTKGAFYHHLDAKDDLVLECFRRSYRRMSRAQRLAEKAGGNRLRQLSAAIGTLLEVQFHGDWPLLRTTALQALPVDVRIDVVARSNRMALRFAGTISDGIGEGSIRAVDPMIASQVVMATLNAAYDLRAWASKRKQGDVIALYASTLSRGLFD